MSRESHAVSADEVAKKTRPPRADALPTAGYVIAVDGKMKATFATAEAAMAAAAALKRKYPVIQAAVYDAAARTYAMVELPADQQDIEMGSKAPKAGKAEA